MPSEVLMLVHVLCQPFRLPPVIMQAYRLLLLYLIRTVKHPRVYVSRCVAQLILHLATRHVLCGVDP